MDYSKPKRIFGYKATIRQEVALELTRVRRSLSHPLFLIVAGALLSSYLLPSLTRQWQNHEKELEVRTTLAQEMSD